MKNILIKSVSFLLIFLLLIVFNSIILDNSILTLKSSAATLNNNDIITGLGIAFILYIFFEAIDNDTLNQPKEEPPELKVENRTEPKYDIKINSINIDLLAKAIYAEARGESLKGQIAVGAVIINRLNSPDFPNTVYDVLYQPGQFTCIENGHIDQTPNQNAYTAAQRAINGEDPSNGALFFYNPEKSIDPQAFDKYIITVVIGNHVFAK